MFFLDDDSTHDGEMWDLTKLGLIGQTGKPMVVIMRHQHQQKWSLKSRKKQKFGTDGFNELPNEIGHYFRKYLCIDMLKIKKKRLAGPKNANK
jgi:hypothetical protein